MSELSVRFLDELTVRPTLSSICIDNIFGTKQTGLEYLETMLRYISVATDTVSYDKVVETATKALQDAGGDKMATIAEELMAKGRQQGIKQGQVINLRSNILGLLQAKFGKVPAFIAPELNRIQSQKILEQLLYQIVLVDSLAQFEEQLKNVL